MKTLLLLLALVASAWGQCGKMVVNPTTGRFDCIGSIFNPAAPGAIGGTTPAAGTFTTLTATSASIGTKVLGATGLIYPTADSTTALQMTKADGTTVLWNLDTTNSRLGLLTNAPEKDLDLRGTLQVKRSTSDYLMYFADATSGKVGKLGHDSGGGVYLGGHYPINSAGPTYYVSIGIGGTSYLSTPGGRILIASDGVISLGLADAASPTAQVVKAQSVVAGTSNTAGADWTFKGSAGTGTGAGGKIIFQTAAAGSTGSTQNTFASALALLPQGIAQLFGTATDPGCTVAGDLMKLWPDTADAATTHLKVCANVASTPTWVTVF